MSSSLQGVYSIYYETMRMLWPKWRRRVDRIDLAARLGALGIDLESVGPLPLLDALELVVGQESPRLRLHAASALSVCHWALTNTSGQRAYESTPELIDNKQAIAEFLESQKVESELLRSVSNLSDAFLLPVRNQGCRLKDFWVRLNVGQGTGETTCAAGVSVDRPRADLAKQINPENWDQLNPEFFEETFRSDDGPDDPDQPPVALTTGRFLFESAAWPLAPNLKVRARNMLNITFDENAPERQLTYFLGECLTGAVIVDGSALGAPDQTLLSAFGGIDRDSGFVDARDLTGDQPFVSFSGLKSIRFTKHLSFLNAFTPAYLLLFITLQIIGGACYSVHEELKT